VPLPDAVTFIRSKKDRTSINLNLIAAAIDGIFLILVHLLWKALFHKNPPQEVYMVAPVVAVGVFPALLWLVSRLSLRKVIALIICVLALSGGAWMVDRTSDDGKITVLVARLGDNNDKPATDARDRVIDSIRELLGSAHISLIPIDTEYSLAEGSSVDRQTLDIAAKARTLLGRKHGDLLIWGQLDTIDQRSVVKLRFVTATEDGWNDKSFSFANDLTLDSTFGTAMGSALAAAVATLAAPSLEADSRYLLETLKPLQSRLQSVTEHLPPNMLPDDRAKLFASLGDIEFAIGEQSTESQPKTPPPLELAVLHLREASGKNGSGNQPTLQNRVAWSITMRHLGDALLLLGREDTSPARLEEAQATYRKALERLSVETEPLEWALTQNELGNALLSLGTRDSGPARLDEARTAFEAAQKIYQAENSSRHWAITEMNLGITLADLGERETDTRTLEHAVAVLQTAQVKLSRNQSPRKWVEVHRNLGAALTILARRENDSARLQDALAEYRDALTEVSPQRDPLEWANVQNGRGAALAELGLIRGSTSDLKDSIVAYEQALKVFTPKVSPYGYSLVLSNLSIARTKLEALQTRTQPQF